MNIWRRSWTYPAALAVLTAVVHTWPLATNPARLSLNYHGDVMLNEWIVAWVQHTLPRDPANLFQANIFHPAPDALAFSEPLIVPALLGAPVRALGGSPVLVHNLLLLAGFVLTLLAGYALAWHWTRDRAASLLAGTAWTFNAQSLGRLEHLQAAHAWGIPLAILAADRLIVTGRTRHAVWLAVWMALMAWSSGYLVIFTSVALAVLLLARVREWTRHPTRVIAGFAGAAAGAGAAILPVYLPYRRVATEQGMVRSLENVGDFSATADAYLASGSHLHEWLWNAAPPSSPDAFFPGFAVASLAILAAAVHLRRGAPDEARGRVVALLGMALAGVVLSLGTGTPVYGWLYEAFPPLSGLRAAARFGLLFLLAAAMLAGIGLHALRARAASSRRGTVLAAGLLLAVNIEALRAPFQYVPFEGIPGIYRLLAGEPGRVVLVEVPFYPAEAAFENAEYVLNSTAHWRPLMNGYSGYTPKTYRDVAWAFWQFPDPGAIEAMRSAGATHLMLHPRRFGADGQETLQRALADPRLERLAVGPEGLTLFAIRRSATSPSGSR